MNQFQGVPIIVSDLALEVTDFRLFPESKHRSKRVHKKLVKRHGGEFVKKPCMFRTPQGYVMHPVRYAEFKAAVAASQV